jgi:CRISPR-associated protein Csb1
MSEVKIEQYDAWLGDDGPVALVIRQYLIPATQPDDIIFPPSYANPSEKKGDPPVYNIDGEGAASVCVLDSIPSQANRLEPMFSLEKYRDLVPQVEIQFKDGLIRNLLEIGHRIADAAFRGTDLGPDIKNALDDFRKDNALSLARLAPTSLIFGAWDSRDSQVKIPRLINSIIRARNVVQLKRSAQYIPAINYESESLLPDDLEGKPSEVGLADVPSVHKIGGVQVNGEIIRDASLNLASLRCLRGGTPDETLKLQRYILGLSLITMATEPDLNLRQGCLLTLNPERPFSSELVARSGKRTGHQVDTACVTKFAEGAARDFGVYQNAPRLVNFDPKRLKQWLDADKNAKKEKKNKKAKKNADNESGAADAAVPVASQGEDPA